MQVEQASNMSIMQIAQTVLQAEFDRQGAPMFVKLEFDGTYDKLRQTL